MKDHPAGGNTSAPMPISTVFGRAGEAAQHCSGLRSAGKIPSASPHFWPGLRHKRPHWCRSRPRARRYAGARKTVGQFSMPMPDRKTDMTSQMGGEGIALVLAALAIG